MANGTFEEIAKLGIQNRRPDLFRLLEKIGARPRGYAEIEIKRIKRDQGIYPREQTDWDRVEIYKEALLEGTVFPPVLVAAEPENLLLDGNHRLAAHEQGGHEKIWIERWDIPKHYLKLVAQAANTEYGQIDTPLTGKEKKRAIIQDWEEGIRDVNLIAEALKTTPNYVRKVLSQAGLIKDRKEEMKKRAKELKEQGLSSRQIAERLSEEFGEEISYRTVVNWLSEEKESGKIFTQVKNFPTKTASTVRSILDDPQKLVEQEERELSEDEAQDGKYYKIFDEEEARGEYEKFKKEFEEQKQRAKELKEQGLSTQEIAQKLSQEFGKDVSEIAVKLWLEYSTESEDYAKFEDTDIPLSTIEYWVGECKAYVETGTDPKEAVELAGVPEHLRKYVVKRLVGYKNHLYQKEEAEFKAKLGPVDSRRRDIILKAYQLVALIQEIEHKLKELDAIYLREEGDTPEARKYERDQYIRDYLTFILVRGGWDKAEWFRETTLRYVRYTLHPSHAEEFIQDMKEQAKLTPEEWEEISRKFWEENLASEAELKWKQFCEALDLPVLKEMGGTE